VVAPGDVDRVELQRPESVEDAADAVLAGWQRARWGEQVMEDEIPPRGGAIDVTGRGHVGIVRAVHVRNRQVPGTEFSWGGSSVQARGGDARFISPGEKREPAWAGFLAGREK
jgi:hypothetical protein